MQANEFIIINWQMLWRQWAWSGEGEGQKVPRQKERSAEPTWGENEAIAWRPAKSQSGDLKMKKEYRWPISTWNDAHHHESLGKCKLRPQWDTSSYLLEWLTFFFFFFEKQNKCWWWYGEIGTFVCCWWEYKIVQALRKNSFVFSQKLNTESLYVIIS